MEASLPIAMPPGPAELDEGMQLMQHLFVQRAEKSPNAIALRFAGQELTYQELHRLSDRMAAALVQQAPGQQLIGLSATRGLASIIGMLAILKAGKAYLPLDPMYPAERLRQYVTDSGLTHCVAQPEEAGTFEAIGLTLVATSPETEAARLLLPAAAASDVAYVIYTSGSTGKPKGVCISHAGVLNLVQWQARNSVITVGSTVLLFAPLIFDASIQEIFFTLYVGGTLLLIENDLRLDPTRLLHYINDQQINRLDLPFVSLQLLAATAVAARHFPACLQEMLTGGEQLKITPQIVQFFLALPHCAFYNQYGPTEASITATNLRLEGSPTLWPLLPSIGWPIDGVEIFILDEDLHLLPPGEVGELCIGGQCLALGYLYKPELTSAKFVTFCPPGQAPRRVYRSGDLARYRPGGELEYLGRIDTQVKIRGNRVELGEIEVLLNHHPGIRQAAVTVQEDEAGQKMLAAYLVPTAAPLDLLTVRASLAQQLPDYMLPVAFGWLDELPKTPSGKIDRNALPAAVLQRLTTPTYRAPASATEQLICGIWQQLLRCDFVSRDDNFFYLGGNSLVAVKMMALLEQQTGRRLALSSLFKAPTVATLAQLVEECRPPQTWKSLVPIRPHGSKTPLYIIHGMGLHVLFFTSLAQSMDDDQPVFGLQAQGLDGVTAPAESVERIAAAYVAEILQHNPTGPYALAGYSLGGIIAYEMTRQLQQQHKTVSALLILDGDAAELTAGHTPRQAQMARLRVTLRKVGWVLGNIINKPVPTTHYYAPLFRWWWHTLLRKVGRVPSSSQGTVANDNLQWVMDAYLRASNAYQMQPLDIQLTVYKARQRINAIYDSTYYGWRPFAQRGVRVHYVNGDHETMLKQPHSAQLARLLQHALDQDERALLT